MAFYKYLIVGTGLTGDAAVRGIRELDASGSIALIGDEPYAPYNRPSLSKGLWKGKPLEKIWRNTADLGAELFPCRNIVSLNPQKKSIRDEGGSIYTYEKLLLATGGTVRKFPFGGDHIIYLRNLEDYYHLRELSNQKNHFGVIGGGFIGSEIAAALTMNGKKVTMVFPEEGIGSRVLPRDLALHLNDYFREKGVEVITGAAVSDVRQDNGSYLMAYNQKDEIRIDGVVAGIGVLPNVELARSGGLETANGIVVDEFLQTNQPDIYSAGDVAEFFQPALAKRMRVEHEDNAIGMGKQAGRNMAGAHEPYQYLPLFFSDLFELGYEAVGELDPRMETYEDWQEPFKKGVVYYLANQRVRGVLLWNVWNNVAAARKLIGEPGPFKPVDLKNRLV